MFYPFTRQQNFRFPYVGSTCRVQLYLALAVCCFDNGYVGKQLVAWKEYWAEYWLKELQESMDRFTGCHNITEILLKTALTPYNQSINLAQMLGIKRGEISLGK